MNSIKRTERNKKEEKRLKSKVSRFEKYLTEEIGIEFKACLYFYCILLFYSIFRIIAGSFEANIIHMAEMIFSTYVMGYVQVYLLSNFDEGERLGGKEICYLILCSGIYTILTYICNWFDKNILVSIIFFFYIAFAYVCAFLIYKIKRDIDEKILNEDLRTFQERGRNHE